MDVEHRNHGVAVTPGPQSSMQDLDCSEQVRRKDEIARSKRREGETKTMLNHGDAGNRTLYLSHAKRALYHMSYIPGEACLPAQLNDS